MASALSDELENPGADMSGPGLSLRLLGTRVSISATAPLLVLGLVMAALLALSAGESIRRSQPAFMGADWGPLAVCALALALSGVVHEAGHVAAAVVMGFRVTEVKVHALGVAVATAPATDRQAALITLAGPAVHVLATVLALVALGLLAAPGPLGRAATTGAWAAAFEATMNLLPLHRGTDGAKLLHHVRRSARHR